jgi:hypothetical protein
MQFIDPSFIRILNLYGTRNFFTGIYVLNVKCRRTLCLLIASQHHDRVFQLLLEVWQKHRMQILYNGLPRFRDDYYILIYSHCFWIWWSQQVIVAAHHCYSWWRWWSDTLWATLIKLWLHSLLCQIQIVGVEILCNFMDKCRRIARKLLHFLLSLTVVASAWFLSSMTAIILGWVFRKRTLLLLELRLSCKTDYLSKVWGFQFLYLAVSPAFCYCRCLHLCWARKCGTS